ncbi:MAG: DUF2301 domain-containing membrane protein [Spirulina sp. SIO3F2]|nr:DUF2301 domain-containing membrane protein [Spirulina sp. SIO3F2]
MFLQCLEPTNDIYQGHFGPFSITKSDRLGVVIYRAGLGLAASCFGLGALLLLAWGPQLWVLQNLTPLFWGFSLGLGVSLATIHIYMVVLHRALQVFWGIGCLGAAWVAWQTTEPLAVAVYGHALNLVAIGWIFVALTGLCFKEAFCFNRFEAKFLTGLFPLLLLGHWLHVLPIFFEQILLGTVAILLLIFAGRKFWQAVPDDIGDKSVFTHLHQAHS